MVTQDLAYYKTRAEMLEEVVGQFLQVMNQLTNKQNVFDWDSFDAELSRRVTTNQILVVEN